MQIQESTANSVVVRMTMRRWRKLQDLEQMYKIAQAIVRGKKQCESAPVMSVENAMKYIDSL